MFSTRRQFSIFVLICSVILTKFIVDLINTYTKKGIKEFEEAFRNVLVVISLTVLIGLMSYDAVKPKLDDKFVD